MATTHEVREIWTALNMAYPYFGKTDRNTPRDPRELAATLKLYEQMLADIDGEILALAAKTHIARSKFFPTIAELREAALEISRPLRDPAIVAWGDVMAAQNWAWPGRYQELHYTVLDSDGVTIMTEMTVRQDRGGEPPFDNPLTARACQVLGGWRAIMASECPGAERARFIQAYETLAERERDEAVMLPEVREWRKMHFKPVASLVAKVALQLTGAEKGV